MQIPCPIMIPEICSPRFFQALTHVAATSPSRTLPLAMAIVHVVVSPPTSQKLSTPLSQVMFPWSVYVGGCGVLYECMHASIVHDLHHVHTHEGLTGMFLLLLLQTMSRARVVIAVPRFNQSYGSLGLLDRLHGTDRLFRQSKAFETAGTNTHHSTRP